MPPSTPMFVKVDALPKLRLSQVFACLCRTRKLRGKERQCVERRSVELQILRAVAALRGRASSRTT